jgi:hypothetical protein
MHGLGDEEVGKSLAFLEAKLVVAGVAEREARR